MANEQNLVKGDEAHKLTAEDQSKGGKKSGEVRRRKKLLREYLEDVLNNKVNVKGKEIDSAEAITIKLVQQAMKGNVKAYTTIRDTLGQAPVQGINLTSEVGDDGLLSALEKGLSEDEDK